MQNLICRLKNEISNLDSDTNVHSFYKYTLHPKYLNHNENFISKYDDVPAFYPHSDGNKYNLIREFNKPVIHYEADNFIPDSYYKYNLKNTDHKKMMLNNIETENEISNDFNRRIRQSESGQPIQEIKNEDDERAENLKKLLDQFNSDIDKTNDNMFMNDDRNDIIDETKEKIKKLNNKYHRPKVNKVTEDIEYNNNIIKKLNKTFTIDDVKNAKKDFYRLNKHNKTVMNKELKNELDEVKRDKENESINNNLMNIEDINTKNELKREKENESINNNLMNIEDIKTKREKENENKIRRKIKLKLDIKNEILNDENPNEFYDSVEGIEIKVFAQEDYNNYFNNLLKDSTDFKGNQLEELTKKLVFSNMITLGLNTKSVSNALKRINEQYTQNLKTQENTPIKTPN